MLGGIFVGGASTRMGRPKGLLRGPSGKPLVAQIAERLRSAGATPVLVGARPEYAEIETSLERLVDARADAGPLAGLVALLEAAGSQPVIAVACDMPWVESSLIARLVSAPSCTAIAPRPAGVWEPLCARYGGADRDGASVLSIARARLERGELSLRGLLDALEAEVLELDVAERAMMRDWDTPASVSEDPELASAAAARRVLVVREDGASEKADHVAVEEPLEIRARCEGLTTSVAVTMRTPGADVDLAVGFLLGEGIVRAREDVRSVSPDAVVELTPSAFARLERTKRSFYVTSSCGVCGKASIDLVRAQRAESSIGELERARARVSPSAILGLPDSLRRAQRTFEHTGSLHAAALFDERGELLRLAEGVGRHNAVDKVLGAELLAGRVPLDHAILFLSGRIAFELVQKAALAGVGVVAGIGGPTSLAVDLAEATGITLVGFVRDGRFNVYAGAWHGDS